jgi:hypothetical protein
MHNDAIWKGTYTDNGMLLKLHENSYTIGYSNLLTADGTGAGKVKFGDGVFYDAHQKNNKVYAGAPTVTDAVPAFAGIVVREPGIASGYPAINNEVADFQKGMIAKEGYIEYKHAKVGTGTSAESLFDNANVTFGTNMYVKSADGSIYFGSAKNASSDVLAGKVVSLNPDDKTVTVYVSPAITA